MIYIWSTLLGLTVLIKMIIPDNSINKYSSEISLPVEVSFITGNNETYKRPDFDDASWKKTSIPANWEKQGYENYDGIGWYRIKVFIPMSWQGKKITLDLGKIDDNDKTYFNGAEIGNTYAWDKYRKYTVPQSAVKFDNENVIAIRVEDTSGNGGLYEGNLKLLIEDAKPVYDVYYNK